MASWGNIDSLQLTGTVDTTVDNANVTGTDTIFNTEINDGDYLIINDIKYKVLRVIDDTNLELTRDAEETMLGENVFLQTGPKYIDDRPLGANNYSIQRIFGSTLEEAASSINKNKNIKQTGWYSIMEYTDGTGSMRYKNELLVSLSKEFTIANSGDADANILPELSITIDTDPVNSGEVGGEVNFTVVASLTNGDGELFYQWQVSEDGLGFTDIEDDNIYTGTNTDSLNIIYSVDVDSLYYRVIVSTDGLSSLSATSAPAQVI